MFWTHDWHDMTWKSLKITWNACHARHFASCRTDSKMREGLKASQSVSSHLFAQAKRNCEAPGCRDWTPENWEGHGKFSPWDFSIPSIDILFIIFYHSSSCFIIFHNVSSENMKSDEIWYNSTMYLPYFSHCCLHLEHVSSSNTRALGWVFLLCSDRGTISSIQPSMFRLGTRTRMRCKEEGRSWFPSLIPSWFMAWSLRSISCRLGSGGSVQAVLAEWTAALSISFFGSWNLA